MPSAFFAELALDATRAADDVTAEWWLLQPRKEAVPRSAGTVPDPSRPPVLFRGTYADPETKPELPHSYDGRQVRRPGEESGSPRVIVSPAAIADATALAGVLFAAGKDDLLVRQDDGVTWSIRSAFPMAGASLKLALNMVGSARL